jgi:putative protease
MASGTNSGARAEIVAPAGNPDKLKFAVAYGADAVYFGGDEFNLRVRADNFTTDDIEQSLALCRQQGVKSIFLLNAFLHEKDLSRVRAYLNEIKGFHFDAIMVSDPAMKALIDESGIECALHLSTQTSVMNHLAVEFWSRAGFSRIVLARETSLDEIKMIRDHSDAEIEIFVHGALCVAYSGRCLLSRYLTGRSANQGDCSQPCRWNYSLIEKKRPGNYCDIIEHASGTEILSSMDLCMIDLIPEYMAAGVGSFKIEGRMKSLYYAANTTRIYKHAVSCAGTPAFAKHLPFWKEELDLISHRPYTADLFNEFNDLPFETIPYIKKALFIGARDDDSGNTKEANIRAYNPFSAGETMDAIYPIDEAIRDHSVMVSSIADLEGAPVERARPGKTYRVCFDHEVQGHCILRKKM